MKHVGTKTIETTRLTLRRLELTDAEMMFSNWTSDDKVTRFLRWDAHKTINDTKNMIQQWVNNYQYDFKGELGYKIGSRWWNQVYSSEAARAVIDYMFRNTDFERIDSFSSIENPASRKVMEKVGMNYEGLLQHYYKTQDGFHDCTLYGIIRNEWEQTY